MRWLSVFAVFILFNNLPAAEPAPGRLVLRSGKVFDGQLVAVVPGKTVTWRHRLVKELIRVDAKDVKRISWPEAPLPPGVPVADVRARMTNGDEIHSRLKAMVKGNLTLETWHAGKLVIPRKNLRFIAWGKLGKEIRVRHNLKQGVDLVQFDNGDNIHGSVFSIEKDFAILHTDFGKIPLPLVRISFVMFGQPKGPLLQQPPRRLAGFAKLHLRPQGWMTVQLLAFKEEGIQVEGLPLGKLLIRREAIGAIEFE